LVRLIPRNRAKTPGRSFEQNLPLIGLSGGELRGEAQRRRRDIIVENPFPKKYHPIRGGIFEKSFLASFRKFDGRGIASAQSGF
jgi:hypothetical protein